MKSIKSIAPAILTIVAIVMVVSLIMAVIALAQRLDNNERRAAISARQNTYNLDKLTFCVNNKISPCGDDEVETWNASGSGEVFTIKNVGQLVDEGVKEYKSHRLDR